MDKLNIAKPITLVVANDKNTSATGRRVVMATASGWLKNLDQLTEAATNAPPKRALINLEVGTSPKFVTKAEMHAANIMALQTATKEALTMTTMTHVEEAMGSRDLTASSNPITSLGANTANPVQSMNQAAMAAAIAMVAVMMMIPSVPGMVAIVALMITRINPSALLMAAAATVVEMKTVLSSLAMGVVTLVAMNMSLSSPATEDEVKAAMGAKSWQRKTRKIADMAEVTMMRTMSAEDMAQGGMVAIRPRVPLNAGMVSDVPPKVMPSCWIW